MEAERPDKREKIVIAGAGPAGSSLAIRLAASGFAVVIIEREKFPRHKLCGEFISPECLRHFDALGVRGQMIERGGVEINRTRFYEPGGRGVEVPSSWLGGGPALSLSRAEMDHALLQRARSAGAEVLENTSINGVELDGGRVLAVSVRNEAGETQSFAGDIFIDATGRSAVLGKLIGRKTESAARRRRTASLVGFKAHLRDAAIGGDRCEIYSFPGGYGGLSPIENGLANHCFLIRPEIVRDLKGDADAIVERFVHLNARAHITLSAAARTGDWLAVSVESFGTKDLIPAANVFSAGDAAAFIDPFTGSGMLMALESSRLLADLIVERSGETAALAATYREAFSRQFRARLLFCSMLRRAAVAPNAAKVLIAALNSSRTVRKLIARSTRFSRSL